MSAPPIARLNPRVIGTSRPWVWSAATGLISLPGDAVSAINRAGQIVGAQTAPDGSTHGVLLTGN